MENILKWTKDEGAGKGAALHNYRRSKNILYDDICM